MMQQMMQKMMEGMMQNFFGAQMGKGAGPGVVSEPAPAASKDNVVGAKGKGKPAKGSEAKPRHKGSGKKGAPLDSGVKDWAVVRWIAKPAAFGAEKIVCLLQASRGRSRNKGHSGEDCHRLEWLGGGLGGRCQDFGSGSQ